MCAQLTIDVGQSSKTGQKSRNEDACGYRVPEEPLLTTKGIAIAIADGVSGSEAGKEASQACIDGFLLDYFSTPESWTVKTSAHKVLTALNHWLNGNSQRIYHTAQGMVTTFSALVLKSNTAYMFHVGDTRIYRLNQDGLKCLTHDHTVIISEDKEFLSRAMGLDLRMDIDYREVALSEGEHYLLMSDGVYKFIDDSDYRQALDQHDSLDAAAEYLVDKALENGSHDNVTCQIVRIKTLPQKNQDEFYRKLLELPFPPILQAGHILDGYKILRHLHSTKRTEVYLAEDTDTQTPVIIKAPSINYEDDANYINQFLHEEWAGRRIENPHVLKVIKPKQTRHFLYYVTEYVECITMRQWMTDNPKPELSRVRKIIEQLVRGIRAFHRLEMIHQDLKPENILIDKHDTVKIIDFGSTKISGIEEIATPLQENILLGTVNYTAPEYHLGLRIGQYSDLFSIGVITYELLANKLPFDKELTPRNIRHVNYVPIREYREDLPLWVDRAIAKAIQINPENRFEELSEFTYALTQPVDELLKTEFVPLVKRNPVKFWRGASIVMFICNIILVYMLLR